MKHLIILNRAASSGSNKDEIIPLIKKAFENLDYEIYETTAPRSAVAYLKGYFKKEAQETVRVYAFGGDGTIHEVVNGIVDAPNAELAIYPVGTGNDFVKYYGGKEKFLDLNMLTTAEAKPIDLSKVSGGNLREPWYSINVVNFGFDAVVGAVGNKNKEKGLSDPYGRALKVAMLKARYNRIVVTADGEKLNKHMMLLCSLAQGNYVGGKFKTAPYSKNDDGLIDICLIKCICFLHLGLIMNDYTAGKHFDKKLRRFVYKQAKKIEIDAPHDIDLCVDGEMTRGSHFEVEIAPKAIKLVIPE